MEGNGFLKVYPHLNLLEEFNPSDGCFSTSRRRGPRSSAPRKPSSSRVFLGFAQWPLWTVTPVAEPEGGVLVKLVDLRFGDSHSFFAVSTVLAPGR